MRVNVWILRQEWDGDGFIQVFGSEAEAVKHIRDYVHEQWNEGLMGDEDFPYDLSEATRRYFERYDGDEWYTIFRQSVQLPIYSAPPANTPEVVDLSEEELEIARLAIKHADWNDVRRRVKRQGTPCSTRLINTVYSKLK